MELGAGLAGVAAGNGPEIKRKRDGAEVAGERKFSQMAGWYGSGGRSPPYKLMDDFEAVGTG